MYPSILLYKKIACVNIIVARTVSRTVQQQFNRSITSYSVHKTQRFISSPVVSGLLTLQNVPRKIICSQFGDNSYHPALRTMAQYCLQETSTIHPQGIQTFGNDHLIAVSEKKRTPLEAALRNWSGELKIWELETASIIDSAITFIFQEKYQIYGNWSALH
ncbi:hypothetical protein OUZ56_014104 [Daphnia magna]|uniref:Uncharacterized protein n=1 Tax=Daphnia magna TaxID=35525 RepID=A0ABQ9Z7W8_9CRUS|nr:hypothetical protein OUZ56_014104 [Daphnia magna]